MSYYDARVSEFESNVPKSTLFFLCGGEHLNVFNINEQLQLLLLQWPK